jgi:hypothetical protein
MNRKSIQQFDVMALGAMTGLPANYYPAFKSFKEKIQETNPEVSVCIPPDLFEDIDTGNYTPKDYMRVIASHLAHVNCIVTLPGWDQDSNCQSLIAIARQLKIEVLNGELVRNHLLNETNWLPKDDRN